MVWNRGQLRECTCDGRLEYRTKSLSLAQAQDTMKISGVGMAVASKSPFLRPSVSNSDSVSIDDERGQLTVGLSRQKVP